MIEDYNYPHLKNEDLQLLSSCVQLYLLSFSTPSATISTTNTNTNISLLYCQGFLSPNS